MAGIVNVMGIPVNIMTETEYISLLSSYINSDDAMKIVYMVSVDTFVLLNEDSEFAEDIKIANLILPCERAVLTGPRGYKIKGIVNSHRYLLYMLRKEGMFSKVCLIGDDVKNTIKLAELFQKQKKDIDICGAYSLDSGYNDESVINDINSKEPDILIMAVDSPKLERWVIEHRQKIYAKVCIGIGSMSDVLLKENRKPADWIVRLGIEDIYYGIRNRSYSVNRKKERIMRELIENYND